jgi:hypothetical protein
MWQVSREVVFLVLFIKGIETADKAAKEALNLKV